MSALEKWQPGRTSTILSDVTSYDETMLQDTDDGPFYLFVTRRVEYVTAKGKKHKRNLSDVWALTDRAALVAAVEKIEEAYP